MNRIERKRPAGRSGFTLLEIMIVLAVLAALTAYILTGLRQQLYLTTLKQNLQFLDMQGSRIMQELTLQLRPAILPIKFEVEDPASRRAHAYELLDSDSAGFNWDGGQGDKWRTALVNGARNIAFVVPVDAQGDGDSFDDAGHIEVGQVRRSGRASLDSGVASVATGDFLLNNADAGPTSSLVCVSPANLDNSSGIENINNAGWPDSLYAPGLNPLTSAFSVVRYIPLQDGPVPVTVSEAVEGVDLDGDGALASVFNIGRLQLVHVGGTHAVLPEGGGDPVMTGGIPHETIDLCADVVLMDVDPAKQQPIFQLVRYSAESQDPNGIVNPTAGGDGTLALAIRVNLFEPNHNRTLRARAGRQQFDGLNRVFETVVALRNMPR